MSKLIFQGHGSYKLITNDHKVIYVDPFIESDYSEPADIILVTHEHMDHNQINLVTKKDNTVIIRSKDMNINGKTYLNKEVDNIYIEAVQAYNKNHKIEDCVGYILKFDDLTIYCSGDTSLTEDMQNKIPEYHVDYCLLPIDGIYNMGPEEASICAEYIQAKHTIPIHMKPYDKFNMDCALQFTHPSRLILEPDKEIVL